MGFTKNKKITRRNFFKGLIISLVSFELIYVILGLSKNKTAGKKNASLFFAGKISSFQNNQIYPFSTQRFYLSKFKDGGLLAISTKCTHLGCMVQANSNGFVCPCHASSFNKYGEVLSPPVTRPLDIFPIEINNEQIMIDINSPIKRKIFDKSQLTYS
jgi:cytochrome b6-f complex iron-sulfur subunit